MTPKLDDFICLPPLGALLAILVALGVAWCGDRIARALRGGAVETLDRAAGFVVAAGLLGAVGHALALAGLLDVALLRALGAAIAALGIWHGWAQARRWRSAWDRQREAWSATSLTGRVALGLGSVTVLALFGAALGPVSDIDSLDYHVGVPLAWLRGGGAAPMPEWFHARFVGIGEGLNLVGLALGADSMGAVFQACGVVVAALAVSAGRRALEDRVLAMTLVTASPILLSLVPTQKPMLLPAAATTVALVMIAERGRAIDRASLVLALACVASAAGAKASFLVSAPIVLALALRAAWGARLLGYAVAVAAVALTVLALPVYARNLVFYGDPLSPLLEKWRSAPDPALAAFATYVRDFGGSHSLRRLIRLPLDISVTRHPGAVTAVLGIGTLAVLFASRDRRGRTLLWSAGLVAALVALFGQLTPRFFLEPYLWCAAAATATAWRGPARVFLGVLTAQAGLTAAMAIFAAATLLPGAVSAPGRERVMAATTDGWALARWIDASVPPGAVIAVQSRAYALLPRPFMPFDVARFHSDTGARSPLRRMLAAHRVSVIVVGGDVERGPFAPLAGSLGRIVAGPVTLPSPSRNPWNRSETTWRALEWHPRPL